MNREQRRAAARAGAPQDGHAGGDVAQLLVIGVGWMDVEGPIEISRPMLIGGEFASTARFISGGIERHVGAQAIVGWSGTADIADLERLLGNGN